MSNIEELEKLMLSEDLEELSLHTNKFNIFTALKLHNNEIRHSNFLGWLLAPYENHGIGDYFLKEFLKESIKDYSQNKEVELSLSDIAYADFSDCDIKREFENIDVLITSTKNKFLCIIENKIWTGEHDEQLSRYARIVNDKYADYKKLYIFLAPNIESNELIKRIYDKEQGLCAFYVPMTYEQVYQVINKTLKFKANILNDEVMLFIKHYQNMIERKIMGNEDEKVLELCRKIYREHKEAIDLIIDNISNNKKRMFGILQDVVKDNQWKLEDSETSIVRFTPKSLDVDELKFALNYVSSNQALIFEFKNNQNSVVLDFMISRVSTENQLLKEKLFNSIANNMSFAKKGKPTNTWAVISSLQIIGNEEYAEIAELSDDEIKQRIQERIDGTAFVQKFEDLYETLSCSDLTSK